MQELGYNTNRSRIVIQQPKRRPQIWRKVFMNGDTVGFFILSRK